MVLFICNVYDRQEQVLESKKIRTVGSGVVTIINLISIHKQV